MPIIGLSDTCQQSFFLLTTTREIVRNRKIITEVQPGDEWAFVPALFQLLPVAYQQIV